MLTKMWKVLLAGSVACLAVIGGVYFLGPAPSEGRLAVAVHDAPCTDCAHVWVTFTSVAVHASGMNTSGWTTLNVSGSTVDLMALNGTAMAKVIGVASLPAGHYEQIRLTVSKVLVGFADGSNVTAMIPAATSADLDGSFNISNGTTTTVSVDIDLATSLHVISGGPVVSATFTPRLGSIVVVG